LRNVSLIEVATTNWCIAAMALGSPNSVAAIDPSKWIEVDGGKWKPSVAVLSELESALQSALSTAASNRGRMPAWTTYTFQFQGRSPLVGPRYVFVNAFCDGSRDQASYRTTWIRVLDGGACYFSAKYEPDTKRLYDLQVNGVG